MKLARVAIHPERRGAVGEQQVGRCDPTRLGRRLGVEAIGKLVEEALILRTAVREIGAAALSRDGRWARRTVSRRPVGQLMANVGRAQMLGPKRQGGVTAGVRSGGEVAIETGREHPGPDAA